MRNRYTMTEATRDALSQMTPGKRYTGRDLHRMIISMLRQNGNLSNPYDSSTLRMVRRYADVYGVVCHRAGQQSKYVKEVLL